MIKAFFEQIHAKGNLTVCIVVSVAASLIYATMYQLMMPFVYDMSNEVMFYIVLFLVSLLIGFICMILLHTFANIKQGIQGKIQWKKTFVPFVIIQSIFTIVLMGLGLLSFYTALHQENMVMSYVINAGLLLLLMLYIPLIAFAYLQIREGERQPLKIISNSIKKLMHHYRSVFYSYLLVAVLFIGYRYFMNVLFDYSFQVAIYDMPLELLTRSVPFLDVSTLLSSVLANSSLWGMMIFSFIYNLGLCTAYVLFAFYMICIHDEDISV